VIQLIVGLANPGNEFTKTRHNVAAWLIEQLVQQEHLSLRLEKKFHGYHVQLLSMPCHLLIPTTYMNNSGCSVAALARYYRIEPSHILIVHDDLDFPPGCIRFKYGGRDGGHKGVKNTIEQLASCLFWRLRIGIGRPPQRTHTYDYVLEAPSRVDQKKIREAIADALSVLPTFIQGHYDTAIQTLHNREMPL